MFCCHIDYIETNELFLFRCSYTSTFEMQLSLTNTIKHMQISTQLDPWCVVYFFIVIVGAVGVVLFCLGIFLLVVTFRGRRDIAFVMSDANFFEI